MAGLRFLPVRDDALLIELDDLSHTLAVFDALSRCSIPGIDELIPGARTILVIYRPSAVSPGRIAWTVGRLDLTARATVKAPLVEIPVHYDGEDLCEVAGLLGLSPQEVIQHHTGSEYTVGFTGFAPGFAYLTGGDPLLDVPRRISPRTRIPAGAVALAGTFSGVYPRQSPGGWQLIGSSDTPMWDTRRLVPALLQPGDRVKFVDVSGQPRIDLKQMDVDRCVAPQPGGDFRIEIQSALETINPGMLTVLEDLGRPGFAAMGVSVSGALDTVSLRSANRLAGNASGTAALEIANGGLVLRARGEQVIAVTGAPAPLRVKRTDGRMRSAPFAAPFALRSGEVLTVGIPTSGVRSYLAVRGGFDIDLVLGSLSTDLLAGLGPKPLAIGTILPVRTITRGASPVGLPETPQPASPHAVVLDVVLGPRTDWFTPDAVRALSDQSWTVTPESNRVGLRLSGRPLERISASELPSEGAVSGAIQIPPNGQPVLFLADHPLTGGYPVIGAVASYHLALAAQLPTGATVRFNPLGDFAEYAECPAYTVCPAISDHNDHKEVPQ